MIASYHMAYRKMVTFNSITLTIITSLFPYLRMYIYIYIFKKNIRYLYSGFNYTLISYRIGN